MNDDHAENLRTVIRHRIERITILDRVCDVLENARKDLNTLHAPLPASEADQARKTLAESARTERAFIGTLIAAEPDILEPEAYDEPAITFTPDEGFAQGTHLEAVDPEATE